MLVSSLRRCAQKQILRADFTNAVRRYASNPIDFPDMGPPIPEYQAKVGESDDVLRSRLCYQSRKRGMTENGLLLSHFASRFLDTFDRAQLEEFDNLINKPSNDWDIFYWMMEKTETPMEYNTPIMNMLKEYIKNEQMEVRGRQPDLKFKEEKES